MGQNIHSKHLFHISGKNVAVYPSSVPDSAIIFLNTFAEEGDKVYQEKNTEKIKNFYAQYNVDTVFQLNPGNHYKDAVQRTAAGISWILSR